MTESKSTKGRGVSKDSDRVRTARKEHEDIDNNRLDEQRRAYEAYLQTEDPARAWAALEKADELEDAVRGLVPARTLEESDKRTERLYEIDEIRRLRGDLLKFVPKGSRGARKTSHDAKGRSSATDANWKMRIQEEAARRFNALRAAGASPTKQDIIPDLVRWCREIELKTGSGLYPTEGYLRTHVLGGRYWKPPD